MTSKEKQLYFANGTRNVRFRYDILRGGIKYDTADVSEASITFNSQDSICGTARFTLADNSNINWLSDTIKPVMILRVLADVDRFILSWNKFDSLNFTWAELDAFDYSSKQIDDSDFWSESYTYVEYPLGEYILSSNNKQITSGLTLNSVEAYDKTLILKEDCITDRLFIASGTKYIDAIKSIFISATTDNLINDDSTATLPAGREFEIGTSKLEIINTLLEEISFEKIYVDLNGIFNLRKFKDAYNSNVDITYKNDEFSVLCDGMTQNIDYFNVPNVFVSVVSNPETDELKSVYTNSNPNSELSTVSRGRNIVQIFNPDMIASQEELDKYNYKKAFEASQVAETVTISTALMPLHEFKNTVALQNKKLDGIYIENEWSMNLVAGGIMTHSLKRMVTI